MVKKNLSNIILQTRILKKKKQEIIIKTCQRKKKKQKENMEEKDKETCKKIRKRATSKKMRKWNISFLHCINISKKTLKFDNVELNKKEIHVSKQRIALNLVDVDQIIISGKFNHSDTGFKYFIGFKDDNIVRPLSIILPQMSGYINYFNNGGKNTSLVIEYDTVLD